jgi:hypothetical protein
MVFKLIHAEKVNYCVEMMCRLAGPSPSTVKATVLAHLAHVAAWTGSQPRSPDLTRRSDLLAALPGHFRRHRPVSVLGEQRCMVGRTPGIGALSDPGEHVPDRQLVRDGLRHLLDLPPPSTF